jgi:TIR domain-containing protein
MASAVRGSTRIASHFNDHAGVLPSCPFDLGPSKDMSARGQLMGNPLNQRANNIFLSHSSRDKVDFVDGLYKWLTQQAGLKVWYDRGLVGGLVSSNLDKAIDTCRSAVIVLSRNSVSSQWVEAECNRLQEEVARCGGDFRIATIRLDAVDPPGLFKAFKHIDAVDGSLSADAAAVLMETLFGGKESAGRPVYLSRGWRPAERPAAEQICSALQTFGLKLVCDWTDQSRYDIARVRNIMDATGGLAAIMPHRGNGATSSYILDEIAGARAAGLPILAFVHKDVVLRPEWSLSDAAAFDRSIEEQDGNQVIDTFGNSIEEFARAWKKPARGEHVFLGHSLEESIDDSFQMPRRLLSRITGLPVEVGGLVGGTDAQSEIIRLIREAELCVIDITNLTYKDLPDKINYALNSCIEAGIALGCSKDLYLTCRGPRRTPPFMFRNKQVWYYDDGLGLVGNLRQIAAFHRRMVL